MGWYLLYRGGLSITRGSTVLLVPVLRARGVGAFWLWACRTHAPRTLISSPVALPRPSVTPGSSPRRAWAFRGQTLHLHWLFEHNYQLFQTPSEAFLTFPAMLVARKKNPKQTQTNLQRAPSLGGSSIDRWIGNARPGRKSGLWGNTGPDQVCAFAGVEVPLLQPDGEHRCNTIFWDYK